ncbi:alpha/beta hydrolase [Rhodanobacter sp. AS-Z3]|uniref:alpha/beta hydrolase n=1 Tax=Rhodanobacter sp. AS-Z3 TaxID=3031330 RepID=UPI002479DDF6|nr:alpha/beta hydrolase [Rhodanobacter sp. AS-Z3]WEN14417.1 alpha/beta hydrolase [Rhodanobacter sp. AS-Z3]
MRGQIILSHGSDTGPDATKISQLAAQAEGLGWRTQRPDYRSDDSRGHADSVAPRIARLRATIEALDAPPLLVGSSMGAFVSGLVSLEVPVAGLLLLATPSEIPGYSRRFDLRTQGTALLIHGWRDEVCPLAGMHAFAARHRLPLLVLDDDHRLGASMAMISAQFHHWLHQEAAA